MSLAAVVMSGGTGEEEAMVFDQRAADLEIYNKVKALVQTKLMEHDNEYIKISKAIQEHDSHPRILFSVSFLSEIAPNFAQRLIREPALFVPPFEEAVNEVARQLTQLQSTESGPTHIRVGFEGWLGGHSITPRGIKSELANKMILIEGIVIRCTPPTSRIHSGAYFIPEQGRHVIRDYVDKYALVPVNKLKPGGATNTLLTTDQDGKAMELEYGLSTFKDYQWITLQEMPEVTPLGQLPRSVEVLAEYDLVDKVKPGDRTRICGILKTFVHTGGTALTGSTTVCLIANHIEQLQIDHLTQKIEPSMIKLFKELANEPNTLDLLANSIAPSISGHKRVRQGLALQLAGGVTQDTLDGLRRRGDIHILLLGDPSCGKSQLLRYALRLAPIAVSATGRGSSAVGLTAAVTSDATTGHKRLEAGAMVLADRGMVCIDEFDKMGHNDRSAVHEVMEQQKVSVFKANISAVLNARTSVLAAANPLYGHFNDSVDFAKQVNFPDSLLSRFDLIFLIREASSAAQDRKIAQQVLSQLRALKKDAWDDTRRMRAMRADVSVPTLLQPRNEQPALEKSVPLKQLMWQHNTTETVGRGKGKLSVEAVKTAKATRLLKPEFLKQFLIYCRFSINPVLSEEAEEDIAEFYGYLREKIRKEWEQAGVQRALPTPRLLEALIRLSTAHAKLKLKSVVDCDDVSAAKSLIVYTLLGHDDEEAMDDVDDEGSKENERPRIAKRTRRAESPVEDLTDKIDELHLDDRPKKKTIRSKADGASTDPAPAAAVVTSTDVDQVWLVIENLQEATGDEDWDVSHICKQVRKNHKSMTNNMIDECLKKLQNQNRLM